MIFLQGVAAFRKGETQNCVECQCDVSCIFPIRPKGVHDKREGSVQAVGYFREYLRRHFEINAESIAAAALSRLARDGKFDAGRAQAAFAELHVDTEKTDPARA